MTAVNAPAPSTTRRGTPGRVALWALQVVLFAIFVFAAYGKVTLEPMTVAGFDAMGLGAAGAVVIGVLELLGAVGLLVPRIAGLAAACLVALMVGAVVVTLAAGLGAMVAIPAVVLVLVSVVAVARRREIREVPALLRAHP